MHYHFNCAYVTLSQNISQNIIVFTFHAVTNPGLELALSNATFTSIINQDPRFVNEIPLFHILLVSYISVIIYTMIFMIINLYAYIYNVYTLH